ncbi:MAG: hypothetical protein WD335_03050 [Candidatus Paceibacterota bacterium]
MSEKANKPTTRKQMALISLIVIVFLLLLVSLSAGIGTSVPTVDRDTCLSSGNIWSESSGECYGNGSV